MAIIQEQTYTRVVGRKGEIHLVPTMPAMIANDGCVLYGSQQVTRATEKERAYMREQLRIYNNRD